MISVRTYNPDTDYPAMFGLLSDQQTFGGVFDQARDSEARLRSLASNKPGCLLVAEDDGEIIGTVTIFEDGRACWLYRFACRDLDAVGPLWEQAKEIAKQMGHQQVLVYAPAGDDTFKERYANLGFTKGNDFTAYWQEI